MNIAEIESSLQDLVETLFDADTFIFRCLDIYDALKATVAKLRRVRPILQRRLSLCQLGDCIKTQTSRIDYLAMAIMGTPNS